MAGNKKKEPPDSSRLVFLLYSVHFTRLISSALDRSGVLLLDFVLECYSLRRSSICAKIQWPFRFSRVFLLMPSFTFVNGLIVHSGPGDATLGSLSGAVRVDAATTFRSPPVTAPLHVSEQPWGAAFGLHSDWSCMTPRFRRRCMPEVIYFIDNGELVLTGILISLMAIPGVFVPLYLSVLVKEVMGGSLDCLRFFMWHLYVKDVDCPVKELPSSDTHQQNPLKCPWFRAVRSDLSPFFPLFAVDGTIGHRIAVYVRGLTTTSISQFLSPCLLEGTRFAIMFSWLSCRFLDCYALLIDSLLGYSFGCHYSWTQWKLACWWFYGLCTWIVTMYSQFKLINVTMGKFLPEVYLWMVDCDHVWSVTPVYVGLDSSQWLGCDACISIIPIFLPNVVLLMHLLGVWAVYLLLTFVWLWWQVPGVIPYILLPLSLRLYFYLCLDQHVLMLCLHLCMHAHPLLGGRQPLLWHFSSFLLSLSLARKHAQEYVLLCTCCCWHLDCLPKFRDEVKGMCLIVYDDCYSETSLSLFMEPFWLFFAVLWCIPPDPQQTLCAFGFTTERPSSARSHVVVLPVTLPAPNVMVTVNSFTLYWSILSTYCWQHHVFFDNLICIKGHQAHGLLLGQKTKIGEAGKGFSPFAYEDNTTEEILFISLILIPRNFVWSACCVCIPFFQLLWEDLQILWTNPLSYRSRPSLMQLLASKRVNGLEDQVLGNLTFMFWLHFEIYWVYMIAFLPSSIVVNQAVTWLSEVFRFLLYDCSLWFDWFVAQHGYVLGLCLMALEQHHPMLGLARRGLGITYISWCWSKNPLTTVPAGDNGFYGLLYFLWSMVFRESRIDFLVYSIQA